MKKTLIWGATPSNQSILQEVEREYLVVGFLDNNSEKWGSVVFDKNVYSPSLISTIDFDYIVIASLSSMDSIKQQIINLGVSEERILTKYVENRVRARINFLRNLSIQIRDDSISGNVAEAGVFQGDFASHINRYFPDKKLYLFDTFSGFDKRDIEVEQMHRFSSVAEGHLNNTSVDMVLQKMKYPNNVVIKKGYFPETAVGLEETFCFISMDLDLYKPTIEGLQLFWDKLSAGGVILIHDYYSVGYLGIKQAVKEFRLSAGVTAIVFPIGDDCSIGLMKAKD